MPNNKPPTRQAEQQDLLHQTKLADILRKIKFADASQKDTPSGIHPSFTKWVQNIHTLHTSGMTPLPSKERQTITCCKIDTIPDIPLCHKKGTKQSHTASTTSGIPPLSLKGHQTITHHNQQISQQSQTEPKYQSQDIRAKMSEP